MPQVTITAVKVIPSFIPGRQGKKDTQVLYKMPTGQQGAVLIQNDSPTEADIVAAISADAKAQAHVGKTLNIP
jgi:hypothetical protein